MKIVYPLRHRRDGETKERCQRCGEKLGMFTLTVYDFGPLCSQCWDAYFELHKKIDLLKLQFIERRQP